jgi:RimJ/RimL family protein N-acetyltransferase
VRRDQPELTAGGLRLRAFADSDAGRIRQLAGDPRVAATTLNIPHPYPEHAAERFIADMNAGWWTGRNAVFAVLHPDDALIGCCGLTIDPEHRRAELGYWIGPDWWNRGHATAAARTLVAFAFAHLGMTRVFAYHFTENPASGRVLAKVGLRCEGVLRGHVCHWSGVQHDIAYYGILRSDLAELVG